jgi:hypothetical protein
VALTKNISVASLLAVVLHYKPPQKRGIVKMKRRKEHENSRRERETSFGSEKDQMYKQLGTLERNMERN